MISFLNFLVHSFLPCLLVESCFINYHIDVWISKFVNILPAFPAKSYISCSGTIDDWFEGFQSQTLCFAQWIHYWFVFLVIIKMMTIVSGIWIHRMEQPQATLVRRYVVDTLDVLDYEFLNHKDYGFFTCIPCFCPSRIPNTEQCLKDSREGRWIERRKGWPQVLKNGLGYMKKWGVLDKKDIINKRIVVEAGSMWVCICVCETMWKLF